MEHDFNSLIKDIREVQEKIYVDSNLSYNQKRKYNRYFNMIIDKVKVLEELSDNARSDYGEKKRWLAKMIWEEVLLPLSKKYPLIKNDLKTLIAKFIDNH